MFQALRQGSQLYILKKDAKGLDLKIGVVESISAPKTQYQSFQPYNNQETTVSIKVKVGEDYMTFDGVPSNLSVANFGEKGVIVSETREAVLTEVESMMMASQSAIAKETIDYHNAVLKTGDEIVKELNPTYKKDKERDETISSLKTDIAGLKSDMRDLTNMLKSTLSKGEK